MKTDTTATAPQREQKRKYTPPTFSEYGSVADLTGGLTSGPKEDVVNNPLGDNDDGSSILG
jgi:hypothetical protein